MKRLKLYRFCTNKSGHLPESRYHILPNDIYPKVPDSEKLDELCRVNATALEKD
jgi:hypothetical protein